MQHNIPNPSFKSPVVRWIDERLPIFTYVYKEYGVFPMPKNLNYFWNFGALAMVVLIGMILTGIMLAMQYTAHVDFAFNTVERIMRDVNYGWLIRYIHMNGASMFFIVVYIHMLRGMYYGSYKAPRELLWILGVIIFVLMMATAFMGYVLPWGQMSFWGATVITNLFSAIPLIGENVVVWLWGGFSVDNPTLNRFFALHFLLPFILIAAIALHVVALHITGSNNPAGIDVKSEQDTVPFHPYFTAKDGLGTVAFIFFWAFFIFYAPNYMGHPDNYVVANPLSTPTHIVPEWYFLPYYGILRSVDFVTLWIIPAKLGGVIAMFGAIIVMAFLPWLDGAKVRSARYRPWFRFFTVLFFINFILLGYFGGKPAEGFYVTGTKLTTFWYFFHLLVILPYVSRKEKTLELPASIRDDVLSKKSEVRDKTMKNMIKYISLALALTLTFPAAAAVEGDDLIPPKQEWSWTGFTGTFDKAQLQRGLQVYTEVCSVCHSLKLVSYRSLSALGYTMDEIKAYAAEFEVQDGPNDEGKMFMRPARPSDAFVSPFVNDKEARAANNGALPLDFSLTAKAKATGKQNIVTNLWNSLSGFGAGSGSDYIYAILTGYDDEPDGFEVIEGMSYNTYFLGNQIAMPMPIDDDAVEYTDGTEATQDQIARDVTAFMSWAAEPELESRKQMGVRVLIFLAIFWFIVLLYKKRVWKDVKKG